MKCDTCNKPIESDYARGLREGRNMGLYYGFQFGALTVATIIFLLTWQSR